MGRLGPIGLFVGTLFHERDPKALFCPSGIPRVLSRSASAWEKGRSLKQAQF